MGNINSLFVHMTSNYSRSERRLAQAGDVIVWGDGGRFPIESAREALDEGQAVSQVNRAPVDVHLGTSAPRAAAMLSIALANE